VKAGLALTKAGQEQATGNAIGSSAPSTHGFEAISCLLSSLCNQESANISLFAFLGRSGAAEHRRNRPWVRVIDLKGFNIDERTSSEWGVSRAYVVW
jgi:hypothetical protein